jgi:hypothetical protein
MSLRILTQNTVTDCQSGRWLAEVKPGSRLSIEISCCAFHHHGAGIERKLKIEITISDLTEWHCSPFLLDIIGRL